MTTASLRYAIAQLSAAVPAAARDLDARDAQLGDGDLGTTLSLLIQAMAKEADGLPDDLGAAFQKLALAISRTSGSSFSGVFMTALMKAASELKGRASLSWADVPPLLQASLDAMMQRGGGKLGDKSLLDGLDAILAAITGESDPQQMAKQAHDAAQRAIQTFRDKPCRLGRARLAGERSIGIDDPGMVALSVMSRALT